MTVHKAEINARIRLILAVLVILAGAAAVPAFAADTRAERLQQERLKKATLVKPPARSSLENALYEFKERRVMERFQAGYKGFHPMLGGLSTGSGFAFGAQFLKADIMDGSLKFMASGQASLKKYQKYEMAVEAPRLADDHVFLSFNFRQRNSPQEDFFGIGSDSAEADRTNFRLEDTDYSASVGIRPVRSVTVGVRAGILNTNTARGTDKLFPSIEDVFDAASAPALDRQPDYRYAGAFVQYDDRDEPLNPRAGSLFRAEGSYYDDRDAESFGFRRWDIEVQHYFPFFNQRRVIAARSRLQLTDTNPGQRVPFFLLPTLGGSEDLRGFTEFRFRDKDSFIFNLEYRWEAFSGLDLAVFGDAGDVFEDVADIKWGNLKTAYGFGFRFNTGKSVFLRLDVGFSREGARRFLKFNHVF